MGTFDSSSTPHRPVVPPPHPQHYHRHASTSTTSASWKVHTPEQSWAALERHCRDDVPALRLRQLLLRDNDRVSALVTVYSTESDVPVSMTVDHGHSESVNDTSTKESRSIIVDLSRQRMTLDTLNLLFRYASSMELKRHIERVAWGFGQNDPRNPVIPARIREKQQQQQQQKTKTATASTRHPRPAAAHQRSTTFLEMEAEYHDDKDPTNNSTSSVSTSSSMHMALRVPPHKNYEMYNRHGHNVLTDIHREWDRIERTSDCYRRGQLRGATGAMIQHVLVIGRGVPVSTLQFVHDALSKDERSVLASRFGLVPPTESAAARLRRNLAGAAALAGGAAAAAAVMMSPGTAPNFGGSASSLASTGSTTTASHSGGGGVATGPRRSIRILSSIDPMAVAEITSDLDPASTLVISIALNGDEETGLATKAVKGWLLRSLAHDRSGGGGSTQHAAASHSASGHQQHPSSRKSSDYVLKHHMVLVTGNDHIASVINKPESVHVLPEHSRAEPFTSFTSAVLMPLSIVFGWTIVKEFLDGAHDMDNHFVSSKMRHNVPVLLALCDVWNGALLGASTRVVTPHSRSFAAYPSMVATLEAQACSRPLPDRDELPLLQFPTSTSMVVDGSGGGGTVYDRILYQSSHVVNTEFIVSLDNQLSFNSPRSVDSSGMSEALASQDAHMCSLFAQADELAIGRRNLMNDASSIASTAVPTASANDEEASEGNRPSILMFTGRVDAFVCGQLVALAEHRAVVKSHLLGLDPFVRRCGASMRLARSEQLKETLHAMFQAGGGDPDDDDDDEETASDPTLNLATRTLLRHYANHSLMFKQNFVREA